MKEKLKVDEENLRGCLEKDYGLAISALEFIPLGLDYNAATYRMVSEGITYFVKVKAEPFYDPSYCVPRYLADHGVENVIAPFPTRKNALWANLKEGRVAIYPFVKGVTGWEGMSDNQWKETGAILKQIHTLDPAAFPFETLRRETFDPSDYRQSIRDFENSPVYAQESKNENVNFVRSTWKEHRSTIHAAIDFLEKFAENLKRSDLPYVLCHADLHAGNLLRDKDNKVLVIDWDDVMLAPKERDFIFVTEAYAEPFFQGYGQEQINRQALAYYLWERFIQDIIYCAKNVCFRTDQNEEIELRSSQSFYKLLTDDRATLSAAKAVTSSLNAPAENGPGPGGRKPKQSLMK